MQVSIFKKYKSLTHGLVKILCTDNPDPRHAVVASSSTGVILTYDVRGVCQDTCDFLVEIPAWESFKIGDKVMVRDSGDAKWKRRYFAGISPEGMPKAWYNGRDLWTADNNGNCKEWKNCRKPTEDELRIQVTLDD